MPEPQRRSIGTERQLEIYMAGLQAAKARSAVPVSLPALEQKAKEALEPAAYDYVAGGAGGERTMEANLQAFSRWRIVPRMLTDVSRRDLSVELFGTTMPAPVLLGPVGVQSIIHPEGEVAVGRAAASLGVPFVLSTASSHSIEDVARAMGQAPRWFQLYPAKDRELNASWLARAERAGYTAAMITLDTRILGWRERDLDRGYLPFLLGQGLANYFSDPVFRAALARPPEEDRAAAIGHWANIYSDIASTWEDLRVLRQQTRLPMILKGVLHPDDARKALDYGVDGIVVSNHGGRQVDGAIAALDALPEVVKAIGARVPVLFDSGIRRGADVLKALALGARAVLLGRLYCWGLAIAGEQGVREVLLNLLADLDVTLALSGYTSCREVDVSLLAQSENYETNRVGFVW